MGSIQIWQVRCFQIEIFLMNLLDIKSDDGLLKIEEGWKMISDHIVEDND